MTRAARLLGRTALILSLAGAALVPSGFGAEPAPTSAEAARDVSRILEVAGTVEVRTGANPDWQPAVPGLLVQPGDRVRTGAESRAALQLSDRSVLRLNERTTLEVQRPQAAEKRRFGLLEGILFFFNRERPAEIEFETPLVTGAIRGTEFVLEARGDAGPTALALLEGRVELTAAGSRVDLVSGERASVEPGLAPVTSPLLETRRVIQWALHYPAVLIPGDLPWTDAERAAWSEVLEAYESGDLLRARAAAAGMPADGEAGTLLRAALDLSVGGVDAALARLPEREPAPAAARALRELIGVVRDAGTQAPPPAETPGTASEWLARSYTFQGRFQLPEALAAAQEAARLAPRSGFAWTRVAELQLAFDRRREALGALDTALDRAPRLAGAWALRGFVLLERNDPRGALEAFRQALALDAALGQAWLGRGLAEMRLRRRDEALHSLQTAVALEPQRALARAYLGKGFSDRGEAGLAEKELDRARALDPADPTAWLYAALHAWMENRPNLAIRDLERSVELNDHRQLFRSRLALDRDLAVRQASLAALYRDAGLPESSVRAASRAVADDYLDPSGHLFLAQSYQALEDPQRFDLRHETAATSEALVASLLAPPGAAQLSRRLPQQESLRFFDPRPLGLATWTEYRSTGEWRQDATAFGTVDGLAYALDSSFTRVDGPARNDEGERLDVSLQLKQRLGPDDELYLQVGMADAESGDLARHWDPQAAKPGLHVDERQAPNLLLGWHHAWSPTHHTLLLAGRLSDEIELRDDQPEVLFLRQSAGVPVSASTPPFFDLAYRSRLTLTTAEWQEVWTHERHTLVAGLRAQIGNVEPEASLSRPLTGLVTDQAFDEPLRRFGGYVYDQWRITPGLRAVAGLAYDQLTHPLNSEVAPLAEGTETRELWAPRAGILWTPWRGGLWRLAYSRSLGGQYFDQSVRLEPAQVAGFPQAFRSLLPESAAGLVPGTTFDAVNAGFDQQWGTWLHAGVEAGWLRSAGDRVVGALTNSLPLPLPDSPSRTRQDLEYEESSLGTYAVATLGDGFSLGLRYRVTEARYLSSYPDLPDTVSGLRLLEDDATSLLQEASATVGYTHASGFFGEWTTRWLRQDNDGGTPELPGEDFWQHDVWVGFRWPRRHAELRIGGLNLTDTDYRLNPLIAYPRLPRERTAAISLRLNF